MSPKALALRCSSAWALAVACTGSLYKWPFGPHRRCGGTGPSSPTVRTADRLRAADLLVGGGGRESNPPTTQRAVHRFLKTVPAR